MSKSCIKYERYRTIRGTVNVIDVKFFTGARITEQFSRVHGPNFTIHSEDTGRSSPCHKFVSKLRYLAAFSNKAVQGRMMSEMTNTEFDGECSRQLSVQWAWSHAVVDTVPLYVQPAAD